MPSFDVQSFLHQFLYDPKNPLLFNNGFFVYYFTVFIALYYIFRNSFNVRKYIFCAFSLYFFYKASGMFVGFVILSAIVDYILSNAIHRQQNKHTKKFLLVLSIMFNLGLLFYFKYTNFFIQLSNDIFKAGFNPLNILLPVGISFYTFENLSYTIDVYRGEFVPVRKFSDYLLFLSFFPKLVMGPIVRASDFIPQINKPYSLSQTDFSKGFYLIVSGLFKKLIISDYITLNFLDYIFPGPGLHTGMECLFAVYGYAIVIYCDFSGYSDVAIGMARWLGFTIPTNFLSPYQSKNITEFWRRWHISLSTWLRDYLYIPLGGNRKASVATWIISLVFFGSIISASVYAFYTEHLWWPSIATGAILLILVLPSLFVKEKKQSLTTGFNQMNTMLLGGFWHGASLNFIVWGIMHGVALALHKTWMLLTKSIRPALDKSRFINILSVVITFHFVCFCWIYFKSANFTTANQMIGQIVHNFDAAGWSAFFSNYKPVLLMMLLGFAIHAIPDSFADKFVSYTQKAPLITYVIVLCAFAITYGCIKSSEQVLPIYLQF